MSTTTFHELSLQPGMLKAIEERGFQNTTAVQAQTIPLTRSGVDILAQSQTGTGKTLAFSIPALERIQPDATAIQVLILSPTRELAQQCGEEIRKLSPYMPHVRTADIYGGSDYRAQFRALRKANLVIGTPGRIMDHIERGTIKLHRLEMIILDEADEMLNMGFKEDIETILSDAPESRQTVLFSATVPKGILEITRQFQKEPVQIDLTKNKTAIREINQFFVQAPKQYKKNALQLLLHYHRPKRSIIFTNTKSMVDELSAELCEEGFLVNGLHGDMKQSQRSTVMAAFKAGHTEILIATDVAARGIDVQDIDFVFNYDLPKITEYYVHRIGRTGRAGRSGTAISLCCGKQQLATIHALAKKTQSTIVQAPLPTKASIQEQNCERNLDTLRQQLQQTVSDESLWMLKRLTQEGYSQAEIAGALMSLCFTHNELPLEDIPVKHAKKESKHAFDHPLEKHRKRENQQSTLLFNIGSSSHCNPNHFIGAITEHAGLSSKNIGNIVIQQDHSLVTVPAEFSKTVIRAMKKCKICGQSVFALEVSPANIKQRNPSVQRKKRKKQAT